MTESIPDETIMQNVKNGELTGMSVIFERYHLRLFNFFIRLGVERDASQDMTQSVFYRMIKYRNTYRDGSAVLTWMYQIARNLHADYCIRQKKTNSLFLQGGSIPEDVQEDTDRIFEDDYQRLEKALELLPENQREILILSRYQGLKYDEISGIMNQSVPAIKVSVHRAIKQLRNIFMNQEKQ